eukprot:3410722-Ditylum_brightwellii.AAC.1
MKIETAPQYTHMVCTGIERKNRGLIGAEELLNQTRATPYYTTINMYPPWEEREAWARRPLHRRWSYNS